MQATAHKYPIFEANQVLTNQHLNQVFRYLEEQERLTRANLIGIGIVCGMHIRLETGAGPVIHLSRGCGVSSRGYLILEPDDVALVAYRAGYTLPKEDTDSLSGPYPPFMDGPNQYPLWELFPAGEPGTTPLGSPTTFLDDKAVLLFLELKKEDLRNCSPNDCHDKGMEVTATVRRLLIRTDDLAEIIASAGGLEGGLTNTDLAGILLERLNLPDLRLPRFDVPNTGPVTSQAVLAAFLAAVRTDQLAAALGAALTEAYQAFRPMLEDDFPTNPFAGFTADFGFLDTAPVTLAQVRFLQYYYDLFDDLIRAYDDFRWQGAELLCYCCPPEDLFPRHLMLGVLNPQADTDASIYRHHFLPSPAVGGCEAEKEALRLLFRRLVEMTASFTHTPPLPPSLNIVRQDSQIRITPSRWADVPLAHKAIPYYYRQNGSPALYQLWNPERTRRRRANQNLSYRADEYAPKPPTFITEPLRYDLEPYNFLRIEGHLGKGYQTALRSLLLLRERYRLPIQIIALRTGAFDEQMPVDLSREECTFQDLEALYSTQRETMLHILCEGVRYFYDEELEGKNVQFPGGKPKLELLVDCAPKYQVAAGSVGAWVEHYLPQLQGKAYIDIDQDDMNSQEAFFVFCSIFFNTQVPAPRFYPHIVSVYYLMKLAELLQPDIKDLDYDDLENKYQDLIALTRYLRETTAAALPAELSEYLPREDLIDHFDAILFACQLQPLRALREEYLRRVREVKQKQFFSHFARQHPGLQHKAGVPMGGTFILVYHQDPTPVRPGFGFQIPGNFTLAPAFDNLLGQQLNLAAMGEAFQRIKTKQELIDDPDLRFLLGSLTGELPGLSLAPPPPGGDVSEKIIDEFVDSLADGMVIADFFLPYMCCSDCEPIQFVLPKTPPTFTVEVGCTNPNGEAELTVIAEGGLPPYSVKVGTADYRPLSGVVLLPTGAHELRIRDADATESVVQTVEIPARLLLGEPNYDCAGDTNQYIALLQISGGSPPYTADRGTVDGNTFHSELLPGDTDIEIKISDSRDCTVRTTLRHTCLPPLAFTVDIGCTNDNNTAPVNIRPEGGQPPYEVRVDNGAFSPLSGPLDMAAGRHTVQVRDAAGDVSVQNRVTVAPPLRLVLLEYRCEENSSTYRAIIQIQGGTPPYIIDGQPHTELQYSSSPIESGESHTVEIIDTNKCTASISLQHDCETGCNLPCEGVSLDCAYRLWLQPPTEEVPYTGYTQRSNIRLRYNGKDYTLGGSSDALQATVEQLNTDYQATMSALVEKLHGLVNGELDNQLGALEAPRLRLTYVPSDQDPFGLFRIEHFECETFTIEWVYTYSRPNANRNFNNLIVRYTNEALADGQPFQGMVLINRSLGNKESRVPAFDCRRRNQCTDGEFEPLCQSETPKPDFFVEFLGDRQFLFGGSVENLPEEEIIAWIWDPLTAQPTEAFYEGKEVRATLEKPNGIVRLTLITREGCFGFTDQNLEQ